MSASPSIHAQLSPGSWPVLAGSARRRCTSFVPGRAHSPEPLWPLLLNPPMCPPAQRTFTHVFSSQGKIRAGSDSANQRTLALFWSLFTCAAEKAAFFAAGPQHGTAEITCFSGLCWSDGRGWPRFHILCHYGLSQCEEYSSPCYAEGPCWPSILYTVVFICYTE